jgi:hypothetical protein
MNWTKLKNSCHLIGLILLIYSPQNTVASQFSQIVPGVIDTLNRPTAESVLKLVLPHLPDQDPSSFNSYSAITYHRFRVANNPVTHSGRLKKPPEAFAPNPDNVKWIYLSEILTNQKHLKPDLDQNENLSAKAEGVDNGSFAELAQQLGELSLLQSTFTLLNKSYLTPLSFAASRKFDYSLRDSVNAIGDTLYTITFRPKKNQRFNGIAGTIMVNTKNMVIQHFTAQTITDDPNEPSFFIDQLFEKAQGNWLPSEKKITVFYPFITADNKTTYLTAESWVNTYQQQVNPPLKPDDFKISATSITADSTAMSPSLIEKTKLIRFVAEGKIPLGYFTLDYNRIVGYNIFEGLKLGLGGETNRTLSKFITFGGYFSYGMKDRSFRHGEWINYFPFRGSDLRIQISYKDVNMELGEPDFLETKSLLNPESYRYLLIKNMYATKRYSTGMEFRLFKDFNYYLFGDISDNHSRDNTPFLVAHPFDPIRMTRAGLQLRYTPGIILQMEDGRKKEMNIPKSDFFLTFTQGLTTLGGEYRFTKLEFKSRFDLPFSGLGTSSFVLRGGVMSENAPIIELFNSYGSYTSSFSLDAPYSFATMQLNEFASARYAIMHFRHDFSKWLYPEKFKIRPAFVFAQNIGFGELDDKYLLKYNLKDYRKGFYESGFEVNNLLRMNFLSWGVGTYYRYGPYRFSSTHKNFAYKFGFIFKL